MSKTRIRQHCPYCGAKLNRHVGANAGFALYDCGTEIVLREEPFPLDISQKCMHAVQEAKLRLSRRCEELYRANIRLARAVGTARVGLMGSRN